MTDATESCGNCGATLSDVTSIEAPSRRLICTNPQCRSLDRVTLAREFGPALLRALGVDPQGVIGVTIDFQAGQEVKLTIRHIVRSGQADKLVKAIEQFGLRAPLPVATESPNGQ